MTATKTSNPSETAMQVECVDVNRGNSRREMSCRGELEILDEEIRIDCRLVEGNPLKIVFMDVDDVSNSDRLIASCTEFDSQISPPTRIPRRGDPIVMALFNRAAEVTGAQVVVISTWLDVVGWSYTRSWLVGSGFDGRHFHEHPCIEFGPVGSKQVGIVDWLKQHPEVAVDQVCVVDDNPHVFPSGHFLKKRQVVVRGPDGLLLEHFTAIIQKLGKAR